MKYGLVIGISKSCVAWSMETEQSERVDPADRVGLMALLLSAPRFVKDGKQLVTFSASPVRQAKS